MSPATRWFILHAHRLHMPTARHYVTTFPNLQVLHASECLGRHSLRGDDGWTERRLLNISQQGRDGSWRSLRGYVESILFLYLLGLPCHVTYVHICDDEYESMGFQQARAVVADTHPEHVKIHVGEVSYILEQADDVIALCGSPDFRALKTFQLGFYLCPGDCNMDMEAMLVSIQSRSCFLCSWIACPFRGTNRYSRSASSARYPRVLPSSDSRWVFSGRSIDVRLGVVWCLAKTPLWSIASNLRIPPRTSSTGWASTRSRTVSPGLVDRFRPCKSLSTGRLSRGDLPTYSSTKTPCDNSTHVSICHQD